MQIPNNIVLIVPGFEGLHRFTEYYELCPDVGTGQNTEMKKFPGIGTKVDGRLNFGGFLLGYVGRCSNIESLSLKSKPRIFFV